MAADFTVEEFVEYWEASTQEATVVEGWLDIQVADPDGISKLEEAATVLANKHGVSSNEVKRLRAAVRAACIRKEIDPLTFKKQKDKASGHVLMTMARSKAHAAPRVIDPVLKAQKRMEAWIAKGECNIVDLQQAVTKIASTLI